MSVLYADAVEFLRPHEASFESLRYVQCAARAVSSFSPDWQVGLGYEHLSRPRADVSSPTCSAVTASAWT